MKYPEEWQYFQNTFTQQHLNPHKLSLKEDACFLVYVQVVKRLSGFKEYYGNTVAGNFIGISALAYNDDNKGILSLFLFQRVRSPPDLFSLMLLSPLRKEQWELRVNENAS